MIETMDAEAVRSMLAPLWAKNRQHILERLAHVRRALLTDAAPSVDARADLHALVGTLGTYGWPEGSELLERIRLHLISRVDDLSNFRSPERDVLLRQLDGLTATLAEV